MTGSEQRRRTEETDYHEKNEDIIDESQESQ